MHDSGAAGQDYVPAAPLHIRAREGVAMTWTLFFQIAMLVVLVTLSIDALMRAK